MPGDARLVVLAPPRRIGSGRRMRKRDNQLAGLMAVAFSALPVAMLMAAVHVTGLPVLGI